jgi:Holliday junction resolvase RusA-like endonuclease
MTLAFTVFGVAQPKGNMRALHLKGMKFPVVTESNRNVKSWSQLVAQGASEALVQVPAADRGLLAYGVRLTIGFYLPRPKKHAKRGVFVPHCVAPDLDKLARAVLDALANVLYHDDKQVTELIAGKYYAEVDAPARIDVRVEPAPIVRIVETPPPLDLPLFEVTT